MSKSHVKKWEVGFYLLDGGKTRQNREGTPESVVAYISEIEVNGLTIPKEGGFIHIPPHAIIRYEIVEVKP